MNRRQRRGANAVEFALTLPVIVYILAGVVDYSYYLHLQYTMINAVSQAARAGATTDLPEVVGDPDPELVAEEVGEEVWTHSHVFGAIASVDATESGTNPNIQISVTGEVAFVPLVGILLGMPTKVVHTTVMRLDDQVTDP